MEWLVGTLLSSHGMRDVAALKVGEVDWFARDRAVLLHAGNADRDHLPHFIQCAFVAALRRPCEFGLS